MAQGTPPAEGKPGRTTIASAQGAAPSEKATEGRKWVVSLMGGRRFGRRMARREESLIDPGLGDGAGGVMFGVLTMLWAGFGLMVSVLVCGPLARALASLVVWAWERGTWTCSSTLSTGLN